MTQCKYCLDYLPKLLHPCNCKTPVCDPCIEEWIKVSRREYCEICNAKFQYQRKIKLTSILQILLAINEDIDNSLFFI